MNILAVHMESKARTITYKLTKEGITLTSSNIDEEEMKWEDGLDEELGGTKQGNCSMRHVKCKFSSENRCTNAREKQKAGSKRRRNWHFTREMLVAIREPPIMRQLQLVSLELKCKL
ncbi:hypothetical protein HAX54_047732 [Datura stramonium]|uniref:Uncharacterized protein n=1 Tax=Datura stramonium TaxID=4076 RepID=A0ABS8SSZ3_DATST|nr:hypothetical protein [Datura stramonium]